MLTNFENLSRFRSETGWQKFEAPKIDVRRWAQPREDEEGSTAGYCIYFETPAFPDGEEQDEEDAKAQHIAYLKSLLYLYYGEDVEFRPCTEFGTFQPFSVEPKKLENLVDNTQRFPIIALGDSFMSAEYTQGTGVRNGVECVNGLISSLEIGTEIKVNDALWCANIAHVINRHTTEVSRDYTDREKALTSTVLVRAYHRYKEYKLTATKPDSEVIINSIRDLAEALKNSANRWVTIDINDEVAKQYCIDFYRAALDLSNEHPDDIEFIRIKTKTLSNLGKLFFKWKDFDKAVDYFQQALKLGQTTDVDNIKSALETNLQKANLSRIKHATEAKNTKQNH